jgi:hypothetical protein
MQGKEDLVSSRRRGRQAGAPVVTIRKIGRDGIIKGRYLCATFRGPSASKGYAWHKRGLVVGGVVEGGEWHSHWPWKDGIGREGRGR